jgi:hydrogenase maturation factor
MSIDAVLAIETLSIAVTAVIIRGDIGALCILTATTDHVLGEVRARWAGCDLAVSVNTLTVGALDATVATVVLRGDIKACCICATATEFELGKICARRTGCKFAMSADAVLAVGALGVAITTVVLGGDIGTCCILTTTADLVLGKIRPRWTICNLAVSISARLAISALGVTVATMILHGDVDTRVAADLELGRVRASRA